MTPPLAPGVYVKDVPSGIRSVVGAGTSTPAFIGFTAQKETDGPIPVHSWTEFSQKFVNAPSVARKIEKANEAYQEGVKLANELERINKYAKGEEGRRESDTDIEALAKFAAKLSRLESRFGYSSDAVSGVQEKVDEAIAKSNTENDDKSNNQDAAAGAVRDFYQYVSGKYGNEEEPGSIAGDVVAVQALASTVSEALKAAQKHTKDARASAEACMTEAGFRELFERVNPVVREKLNLEDVQALIEAEPSLADEESAALQKESCLAEAVMGFFSNGGASCYIVPIPKATTAWVPALTGLLQELEKVGDVSMVAVPDMHLFVPPDTREDPAAAAAKAMGALAAPVVSHCEKMGDRVAVLAPPFGLTADKSLTAKEMETFRGSLSVGDNKDFATLYYPWVKAPGVEGTARFVPPVGHICGVWAATDNSRGVFKAPANVSLAYATDLATILSDDEQGSLNDSGVNCLRSFPGRPLMVWGARTLSDDRDWKYLNVRRLVCFLADSIKQSTAWAVFEPNDERLWSTLRHSVSSFLKDQWRQGALQGAIAEDAFSVKCDAGNNPSESVDLGEVHLDIYVAPVRPAEFVHIGIQQIAGQPA
ncbi:phage tail sheath subtilisin-like domain-containing protein (plasmid) [Streptomyces murinus]|uniref:phage tail sheath family protein n=1 Tax=Streptomyces murinus TaxID=33900 RepID=UPI000A1D5DF7|nr:phage tail sheath subtilisin-like domain-containing protein [Streptomyces murinus]WDO11319.1 phage tail sheath subtilisin-like domain-containing protein [Streptomyces murinus]